MASAPSSSSSNKRLAADDGGERAKKRVGGIKASPFDPDFGPSAHLEAQDPEAVPVESDLEGDADVLADVIPELVADDPAPDDRDDRLQSFKAYLAESTGDSELGVSLARQRLKNVKEQQERAKDPAYRAEAERVLAEWKAARDQALKEADEAAGIAATRLLTEITVEDLIASILLSLGYPPDCTDIVKRFGDTDIPTIYGLDRHGLIKAWHDGLLGLIDVHPDNKHSANKDDSTFPHGSPVDFDACGCSNAHHAILVEFWEKVHRWRFENVLSESLFSAISLVKIAFDNMIRTVETPHTTLPRMWSPLKKYAPMVPQAPVRPTTLYFSTTLVPEAPPIRDTPELVDHLRTVKSFSYLSSIVSHISAGYYEQPSRAFPALGSIQHIERALDEIRVLLDIEVDEKLASLLTRAYLSRCLKSSRFFVPARIRWSIRALDEERDADEWNLLEVEERIGRVAGEYLEEFARLWEESGEERIGRSGDGECFLDHAIAGWKLSLRQAWQGERFPVLSGSGGALLAPALDRDGGVPLQTVRERAWAALEHERYPVIDQDRTQAIVAPAIGLGGAVPLAPWEEYRRVGSRAERGPSLGQQNGTTLLAPTIHHGGAVPLETSIEQASIAGEADHFPALDAFEPSTLLAPALNSNGAVALDSYRQAARNAGRAHRFPAVGVDRGAVLLQPAVGHDGAVALSGEIEHLHVAGNAVPFPALGADRAAVLAAPAIAQDGAVPIVDFRFDERKTAAQDLFPVTPCEDERALLTPAVGLEGSVAFRGFGEKGLSSARAARYPVVGFYENGALDAPAMNADGSVAVEDGEEPRRAGTRAAKYPAVGGGAAALAPLIAPAIAGGGEVALPGIAPGAANRSCFFPVSNSKANGALLCPAMGEDGSVPGKARAVKTKQTPSMALLQRTDPVSLKQQNKINLPDWEEWVKGEGGPSRKNVKKALWLEALREWAQTQEAA